MTLVDPPDRIRRVAFLGTPEIAVPSLEALVRAGYEIPIVVTGPDRRRGRGGAVSYTPVKRVALDHGLTVTSEVEEILEHDVDLGVVVAFGRLIRGELLQRVPMVNLHFSLLPRWRGAAPVERAILAGDPMTGVAVMQVVEGLDEGDIWAETTVEIGPAETAADLRDRLAVLGAGLLVETLESGLRERRPQVGEPLYAHKIGPEDRRLDWSLPATQLERIVRIGGAWSSFRGGRFKIHGATVVDGSLEPGRVDGTRVGTGDGCLELAVVQPEGKGRMTAQAWCNGFRPDGEILG